jgi:hypothetical protein
MSPVLDSPARLAIRANDALAYPSSAIVVIALRRTGPHNKLAI